MALVLKKLYKICFLAFEDFVDPRVKSYPFTRPLQPMATIAIYLFLVFVAIPKFMKNREPLKLKSTLILYNLSQIVFNLIFVIEGLKTISNMTIMCNKIDFTYSTKGLNDLQLTYGYYLLKLYDLFDTIFIVLKKNSKQASFLHVYHHCAIATGSFIALNYLPGGEIIITGFLNVVVHSFMYLYYLLAALDSRWKKNMAVKKSLTQLQLVQFALNILVFGRIMFLPDCEYLKFPAYLYTLQNVFMILLFWDFYKKAYLRKKPTEMKAK